MGLDMYLSARFYLSEYSTKKEAYVKMSKLTLPGVTIPKPYLKNFGSMQLEVPIAYWRKAHHIHDWFVREVQDGVDNCESFYVDVDKLRELDKLCANVVMANSPAFSAANLPADYGYDSWYMEDCRVTMDALHRLLADIDADKLAGWDFYYHASW